VTRGTQPRRGTTVKDDWRSWLSERKEAVFRTRLFDLETAYGMFSVALNEALGLHHCGRVAKSWQAACVTPALCDRLALSLSGVLFAMEGHAKHYGTVPNAAPLDVANFRGTRGQRLARLNSLVSRVLLTERSQFFLKIRALEDMVNSLRQEFCTAAEDLAAGTSQNPTILWETLDSAHFDLNTCFRETIVILKSFLIALPDDQLSLFDKSVRTMQRSLPRNTTASQSLAGWYHRRRAAQVAGK
jgi:hypothetical protein